MLQTTYSVTAPLNTVGTLRNIREIRCRFAENQHDLLSVVLHGYPKDSLDLRTGDPIQAKASRGGNGISFVGHVQSVQPLDTYKSNERLVLVRALGPSYRMKDEKTRAWSRVSVSSVASQIAREHRLAVEIEAHPHLFDTITQPGISDWALLVKMAKMVGYVVFVNNATLVFRSRTYRLAERQQGASTLEFQNRGNHLTQRSGIYTFEPTLSEAMPYAEGMKGVRQVYGVDPRTGQMVTDVRAGSSPTATRKENGAGLFALKETTSTALSPSEARVLNAGKEEQARFQHRAHVKCEGRSNLRQCDEIYLSGLPNHYSGYWTTLDVTHVFNGDGYSIDMNVGTDSIGTKRINTSPVAKPGRAQYATPVLDPVSKVWIPSNTGIRATLEQPRGVRKARV